MVIKGKTKICLECQKNINLTEDKHVLLGTYSGQTVDDESYFHFACFIKWYNHKVSEKAKNSVSTMQSKVQGLMSDPKIAGLLSMVGGVDKLKGMLDTNLMVDDSLTGSGKKSSMDKMIADIMGSQDQPEEKAKIIKKKTNNGRKKGKTTKAKV
jgi:hypothetical protein